MSVFSCVVWKGASLVIRCGQLSSCSLTAITPLKASFFFFLNKSVLIRTDLSLSHSIFFSVPTTHSPIFSCAVKSGALGGPCGLMH